ncbi:MAG TPA: hypothetical protein VG320_22470 [Paraburkholderia sp.]|jgi:hypothetical protein|uniref:hypothetical protein n=1 Tax=Paraburkholderia sp. TaxID=1926495 RepID=UPI002DECD7C3|nr:hypothetical protein [Paraburkholderia sp.]
MKLKLLALTAAIVALAACNKGNDDQATAVNPASTPGTTAAPAAAPTPAPAVATAPAPTSQPDNTPLANYQAVDASDGRWPWLTYVSVAHAQGTPPSQEDLLNLFSGKYYNEHDTFKKHDLIATEWPVVQAQLKQYAGSYYAIPLGSRYSGLQVMMFAQPYDFASKSFPVSSVDNGNYINVQNVALVLKEDPSIARIPVSDENLARQIENMRSKSSLDLEGTLYIRIDGVTNGNQVHATVEHIHYDVYDRFIHLPGANKIAQADI